MSGPPESAAGCGPVARGARAAAQRLAPGSDSLAADVEATLHAQNARRPDQYVDPISLGALIVAAASLAWTVYTDLRAKTTRPALQVVARRVRTELADQGPTGPTERDRIIEIVVAETIPTDED